MALQKKIEDAEIALLELIEDPVWFSEFLRSTNQGDMNKNNWPSDEFKHRPYQKEILTDQNKHIVITGGRSIGKCQPLSARVFTTEGYKTVGQLLKLKGKSFMAYAYGTDGKFRPRRAVVTRDKWKKLIKLYLPNNIELECTENHPILTTDGFKLAGDIKLGELVAVTNILPSTHCVNDGFSWFEMRLLGYSALHRHKLVGYVGIKPRFNQIAEELELIAKETYCTLRVEDGKYYLDRIRTGQNRHYLRNLWQEIGMYSVDKRRITRLNFIKKRS